MAKRRKAKRGFNRFIVQPYKFGYFYNPILWGVWDKEKQSWTDDKPEEGKRAIEKLADALNKLYDPKYFS